MKYTTIIGTVLAALSLTVSASPIAIPENAVVAVTPEALFLEHDLEEHDPEKRATTKPTTNTPATNKPGAAAAAKPTIEEKSTTTYAKVKDMLKKDLDPGYYKFTLTWDIGSASSPSDPQAIKDERQRLGFDHIAVVVGQVTRTKTFSNAKKEVWQRDITGWMGDMTGITSVQNHVVAFRAPGAGTKLHLEGTIVAANAANPAFKAKGDAYVAAHPTYNAQSNNCNSYAQAVLAQL